MKRECLEAREGTTIVAVMDHQLGMISTSDALASVWSLFPPLSPDCSRPGTTVEETT